MKKTLCLVTLGMVLGIGEVAAQTTITTTTIATDTTWTLTGSPYIVTGDVYVKGAVAPCLIIEPGVVVKFNQYTNLYIYIGGNSANEFDKFIVANCIGQNF
ncbi:MAG: hypothetical protein AB1422_18040 [bacterium]